ncbi:MAG: methylated-DNA--[protein]-cysteine S-methyltransferase [Chloroflexi bacterium]|nr:methylated-DNA--[protein]-cysteine S-methyltransferase [Chloroflexota bacterium]
MDLTFAQIVQSPIGPLSFAAGDHGLRWVAFTELQDLKTIVNQTDDAPSLSGWQTLGTLLDEINAYLSGLRREFTIDIDWDGITGFQKQVLHITHGIPYGQVLTYGAIAKQLGKPGAARAVGTALARNPMPIVIPCHRVIGSDSGLHGFGGGLPVKEFLLTLEGHTIVKQKLVQP